MPLIKPQELIDELGVEGLCATADTYFEDFDLSYEQMRKPFSNLTDSAHLLRSLGNLLAGLQVRRGMTVLEFGAGTCWLSRYLAQMGCATVSVDASAKALELGREWFEHLPPALMPSPPQFIPFDGHRLDVPDESVDRIICFDAFHHVPNPGEVIAEFGRVLKPGGMVGLSEPGPHHSKTAQSQMEMRQFKVLENDIIIEDIERWAKAGGFTNTWVELSGLNTPIAFTPRRVGRIAKLGSLPGLRTMMRIIQGAVLGLRNQHTIYLAKGPLEIDSRWVEGLAHELTLIEAPQKAAAGEPFVVEIKVRNTGRARWLRGAPDAAGTVRLAVLEGGGTTGLPAELGRFLLPRSLAPGEELQVPVELSRDQPGRLDMRIDLVAEHIAWFENTGSEALEIAVEIEPA